MTTDRRLRRREASEYLREKWNIDSSEGSLANHASKGTGPEYRLIGGLAHYEEPALDSWAISRISAPIRKASEARAKLYEANLHSGKAGAAGTINMAPIGAEPEVEALVV